MYQYSKWLGQLFCFVWCKVSTCQHTHAHLCPLLLHKQRQLRFRHTLFFFFFFLNERQVYWKHKWIFLWCNFQGGIYCTSSASLLLSTHANWAFGKTFVLGCFGFLRFFFKVLLGFIDRDAEEMLREKELGCFLIRLSDKAIGYILSYKWVLV